VQEDPAFEAFDEDRDGEGVPPNIPLVTIRNDVPDIGTTFTTGRIGLSPDPSGYFWRQLARHYLNRSTMLPTVQGRELLGSDYVNLLQDEQTVLRELVNVLRAHHRCNVRQFASMMNMAQYKVEALYALCVPNGESAEQQIALSSIDQKSVEAAREAGISTMVNSLYRTGMRAHDLLLDNVQNLDPDQQIKLMQASLKLATDMSKAIKGGGRLKVGEMNSEQLSEKLKEAYKLLKIVNAQDTGVVQ